MRTEGLSPSLEYDNRFFCEEPRRTETGYTFLYPSQINSTKQRCMIVVKYTKQVKYNIANNCVSPSSAETIPLASSSIKLVTNR